MRVSTLQVVLLTRLYLDATLRVGGREEKEEEDINSRQLSDRKAVKVIFSWD